MTDYCTRNSAAAYASERLGRRVTPGSLARMASDGYGPRYVMILGRASYRDAWLDEWLEGLVREPEKRAHQRRPRNRSLPEQKKASAGTPPADPSAA